MGLVQTGRCRCSSEWCLPGFVAGARSKTYADAENPFRRRIHGLVGKVMPYRQPEGIAALKQAGVPVELILPKVGHSLADKTVSAKR
jgi:hypothetical protein